MSDTATRTIKPQQGGWVSVYPSSLPDHVVMVVVDADYPEKSTVVTLGADEVETLMGGLFTARRAAPAPVR